MQILLSLLTVEVPENIPFPDGKEISPTEHDWSYSITGELGKEIYDLLLRIGVK